VKKFRNGLVGLVFAAGVAGGVIATAGPAHASAASGCETANTNIQTNPSGNPAAIIVTCQ
jgi:hypothetical protein